ncbi:hypothetical protein CO151_01105 [bacterium CG_4_9_14_3_um_filter_65_15]|nr:MAG: hypothetical protein CO151_01105 [bacterium CG_4_9_14_3_um_filter_65_15]
MKCQHCSNREATVHLVEMDGKANRDLWLCSECADAEQWRRLDAIASGSFAKDDVPPADEVPGDAFDSMLRFLGSSAAEAAGPDPAVSCSHCGTSWADFQDTGKLGCARCYNAFRLRLQPLLAAFHRHATHMGRAPGSRSGGSMRLVEVSRLRVALEKAIAGEKFEEAARLRDQLRILQVRPDQEDDHGG